MRAPFVASAILAGTVATAHADGRILLVNSDRTLEDAVSHVLAPWNLAVVTASEKSPPSESMPGARDRAETLSQDHHARAVVWLSRNSDGDALWVYDQEQDRVFVRKLAVSLPLNDAEASSVALSIKTLLMLSELAPAPERFGAESENSSSTPARAATPRWSAESRLGLRYGLEGDKDPEIRLSLGAYRRVGPIDIGASLALGTGHDIDAEGLVAHHRDLQADLGVRYPFELGPFESYFAAELSLHATRLSGRLSEEDRAVELDLLNPSVGLRWTLMRPIGRGHIGAYVGERTYLRSQRFLVYGVPVLDLPTAELDVGAVFLVSL